MSGNGKDPLDELARDIEDDQDQRIRETYGDRVWRRWRHPARMGRMSDAHGHGSVTGACGDTLEVFLRFEADVVQDASFVTDGCGPSQVCGSMAAELALGKSPAQLAGLDGRTILEALGGLPEDDAHCAFLAVNALHGALHEALARYRASNESSGEKP